MIQTIGDKCTGCNACLQVCRFDAISLITNDQGFWYPKVDETLCAKCGACLKRCPVAEEVAPNQNHECEAYAAWSKKNDIRKVSSSGGIFSELAHAVLDQGGYVVGAAFCNDFTSVKHIIIHSEEELGKLRGSKYVQSFLSKELFDDIKNLLDQKRLVLFSGTPCQVAGLYGYLRKEYENLMTVDIICHGVPSPMVWKYYLATMERLNNSTVQKVEFRAKDNGWKKYNMALQFDKSRYSEWFNNDLYGITFINNMFLRECCYQCKFKTKNRIADISLGDFWQAPKEFDVDDMGCSLVLGNTSRGKEMLKHIQSQVFCEKIDISTAYPGNYALFRSSSRFLQREHAFKLLKRIGFENTVMYYTSNNLMIRILRKIEKAFIRH